MAGAYVQTWSGNGNLSSTETLTISGATADNLLVAAVVNRQGLTGESYTHPTGWTLIQEGIGGVAGAVYYRIATGDSNDNFTWTLSTTGRWAHIAQEFSGLQTTTPLDGSNENESGLDTSLLGSLSTGSVTPSVSTTFAVAYLGADGSFSSTTPTIDSSFGNLQSSWPGSTSYPMIAMASKDLTTTDAVNPTWSGDSNDNCYAALAVFKETTGGGFEAAWAQNSTGIVL